MKTFFSTFNKQTLILPLLMVFTSPAAASLEGGATPTPTRHCISEDQARAFSKDFKFRIFDTIEGLPICNDSRNDSVQILYSAFQGLSFLKNLGKIEQGRWIPEPEESSSIWDWFKRKQKSPLVLQNEGVYAYLKKRVQTFFVFNKRPGCGEDTVAFVSSRQRNSVFLCSPFRSSFNTPLLASYVLVHEARHINGFKHAACGSLPAKYAPYFLGAFACDATYEEQGSYGIAASFLLGVYDSSKNELVKQEARAQAALDLVSRFNTLPFPHQEGALALQEDGTTLFYDGLELKPYLPMANKKVQSLTTRFNFPIFFLDSGKVLAVELQKDTVPAEGLFANIYETQLTPSERTRLISVFYDDELSCLVFEKHLFCRGEKTANIGIEIPLLDIQPHSIQRFNQDLVLVDQTGTRHAFPAKLSAEKGFLRNAIGIVEEGVLEKVQVASKLQVGINLKGELVRKESQQWVPVPEAAPIRFKNLVPLDIYEDLNNL